MATRRSRPTFPIPQEVIDAAEKITGSAQRVMLAQEIRRCIEEDDGDGGKAVAAPIVVYTRKAHSTSESRACTRS